MNRRHSHAVATTAALAVLTAMLSACGSDTFERCVPKESAAASSADLSGTYEGRRDAEGVRLTLATAPNQSGGTLSAENWPTGDYYWEELGDTFDGSGTWEIDPPSGPDESPMLRLHFDKPKDMLRGDTVDLLTIAADSERTVIYKNADPDTCPSFRLDLKKP
ncbi:hypothetical protein AB0J57_24460 [Streptomyces sp. NPDC049837]|uniref:hypothetical protein n=1 Tax=Streptomyces sp. NPDC049837 TaxID=3155277 RepID=UPI00341D63A0